MTEHKYVDCDRLLYLTFCHSVDERLEGHTILSPNNNLVSAL